MFQSWIDNLKISLNLYIIALQILVFEQRVILNYDWKLFLNIYFVCVFVAKQFANIKLILKQMQTTAFFWFWCKQVQNINAIKWELLIKLYKLFGVFD